MAAAEMAEKVLEYQWDHLKFPDRFVRALTWSRVACAGFLKIVWDKSLGEGVEVLMLDGRPMTGPDGRPMKADQLQAAQQVAMSMGQDPSLVSVQTVNQGDIQVAVRSPFQIFPDPLAETFSDLEWLIEESVLSEDYVLKRYRRHVEGDTPANPGLVESRLGPSLNGGGSYKGVKVRELWRKPCQEHPNGYYCAWTNREILETDERPFDPFPYVMFSGIPVPGRFWPTSITEQLRGPQTELNKTKSQLAENRNRVGNPTILASRQAIPDPDQFEEQMTQPGGVMYFDDTSQNALPQFLTAPEMPNYVVQQLDRIEASMQEISGQHEVSSAQVPAGVTAASAINLLQEADDTRLGPAITDMERQLARAGRKVLRLVAQFYDDSRTVALAGENQAWEIFDFRGQMLRDHTHVEVQAGSTFPKSLAAKQAAMESTLNLFLQNGVPFKEQDLARFLRAYNVGGVDNLVSSLSVDQSQVNRENRQLTLGEPVPINDFDDDAVHIDSHTAFQKTQRYASLAPQIRQIFEMHVQQHRDRVAAQQQAEQQLQMQPQLAQTGQQMQIQGLQAQQQMDQQQQRHDQQMQQSAERHQQQLLQAPQQ